MKRLLMLALVAASACLPASAFAAHFAVRDLAWRNTNSSNIGNKPDTLYNVIAVGKTDSTIWFSTDHMALPNIGTTDGDSVAFAYVVIYPDSAAAGTHSCTEFTVNVDASGGGKDAGSQSLGAITLTDFTTSTDYIVKIPLYINTARLHGVSSAVNWAYVYPALRVRIAGIGGVLTGSLRVKLVYLED